MRDTHGVAGVSPVEARVVTALAEIEASARDTWTLEENDYR
jgi:hypothetical protein